MGIRNQNLGKVKKFQVWGAWRFFELMAKNCKRGGGLGLKIGKHS